MNQRIVKIKNHLVENKVAYFTGAGSLAVGVVGTLAFTQRVAISQQAQNIALLNWKPFNFLHQTTIVQLPARGHRGIVLINEKTFDIYGSQNEAARALGVHANSIAQHLKGIKLDVGGITLTSLGENLTEQVKIPK